MKLFAHRWRPQRLNNRRGHALTVVALLFPVFLGISGLALDGSYLYHVKRRMQTAADAGAMGGAHELWRSNPSGAVEAAKTDVNLNGYTDSDATITVNIPPGSGAHSGDSNFVEVIISRDVPIYFTRIFNRQSATVKSRAVAGLMAGADACVTVLDPTQRGALTVEGTSTLNADCGIVVASNDNQAIRSNGGGCIDADQIGVTGGWWDNGTQCTYPAPVTGIPRPLDPLAYMAQPSTVGVAVQSASQLKITNGTVNLQPGWYQGGIQITGGTVNFAPGTYILDSGLDVSGSSTLNGMGGVTFFNTNTTGNNSDWSDFKITGSVTVKLQAPSSGPYKGMLFWNDRNAPDRNPGAEISGTANSVMNGAVYFPSVHLKYAGSTTLSSWQMIVAKTITVSGNAQVVSDYDPYVNELPTRLATLVE